MITALRIAATISAAAFGLTAGPASSEPAVPNLVKVVVPFSPGASNDVFGRALAAKLSKELGVNVIVENKPGAGGTIGTSDVATSKPDGATLLFTSVSFVTHAAMYDKLPYDPIKSFSPVAVVATGPMVMVTGKSSPHSSAAAFLDDAKARRGELHYGSAGIGSIGQMSSELLNLQLGTDMVHIPYKGISNAVTDMVGGRLETMITTPASVSGPLAAKDIRVLATTSAERSKFFPDVPTLSEIVPGYKVDVWWGMYAPANTPPELVAKYNAAIRKISSQPDMREMFAKEATEPTDMDPAAAGEYVKAELIRWKELATERNIVAQK